MLAGVAYFLLYYRFFQFFSYRRTHVYKAINHTLVTGPTDLEDRFFSAPVTFIIKGVNLSSTPANKNLISVIKVVYQRILTREESFSVSKLATRHSEDKL